MSQSKKYDVSFVFGSPSIAVGAPLTQIGPGGEGIGRTSYDLPVTFQCKFDPVEFIGGSFTATNAVLGTTSLFALGTDGINLRFDVGKPFGTGFLVIPDIAINGAVALGLVVFDGTNFVLTTAGSLLRICVWYARTQ
jgi:hypothetical protein